MVYIESSRCKKLRRVICGMFIVIGYMLSTTFAYAYIETEGEGIFVHMTALNLAFGNPCSDTPMYRNTLYGVIYILLPFIGFLFTFFDHKSNVKNYVSIVCGIIGCSSIALPIGFNPELTPGIGAITSIFLYTAVTSLSAISVLFKIQEQRAANKDKPVETSPRLGRHV